jgi:hypothetical protein
MATRIHFCSNESTHNNTGIVGEPTCNRRAVANGVSYAVHAQVI